MGSFCPTSTYDEEPSSPISRLFHEPRFNYYIIAIFGCKTSINPTMIKAGLKETLLYHPRFSSKMVVDDDRGEINWVPTTVNIEEHVIAPELENNMPSSDKFVEDYVSNLSRKPMDVSRPQWEVHLLNVKTSDAEAIAVFKLHHSIGDGTSCISLLLACTRKSSNPEFMPTIPRKKRARRSQFRGFWSFFSVIRSSFWKFFNTITDLLVLLATIIFLKDTKTSIKGGPGVELTTKRFVHKTVSFDDIKLIKNAMNMTVNDVLLGVTQATLSQYLNRRYGDCAQNIGETEKNEDLPQNIRLRAIIPVNLRPEAGIQVLSDMMTKDSKNKWGNRIGFIIFPFTIASRKDPLDYLRQIKATIQRKKHSFEAIFTFLFTKLLLNLFGAKATADFTRKCLVNTTVMISNLVGPLEEVSFYDHPMAYLALSVNGLPQALTVHYVTYVNKMTITLAVDPNVIPDPHKLCDDLAESLELIKNAIVGKSL